ncbi:MAG: hypothetical protein L6Q66_07365 [Bacteroidia bacterium]|nr:hypothetical protein [Bacteroidia bacterium]
MSIIWEFGDFERFLIHHGLKVLVIFVNLVWAIRMFEGSKKAIIMLGVFSGIFYLAMLYAIIYWFEEFINDNFILTILLIFLAQCTYWEIIIKFKPLKYRNRRLNG